MKSRPVKPRQLKPRPLKIDVFQYLNDNKDSNNTINIGIEALSKKTGFDTRTVRRRLKTYIEDGCISVKNNYTEKVPASKTYYIIKNPDYFNKSFTKRSERIRQLYINSVINRNVSVGKKSFSGYMNVFSNIAKICYQNKLNDVIYILACFHTFKEEWCVKTFGTKYPPPYILTAKRGLWERYNSYMRFICKNSVSDTRDKNIEELLQQDFHFWKSIGSVLEEEVIELLLENESISPLFIIGLPFIKENKKKELKIEYDITDNDFNQAKEIIKQLLEK